MNESELEMLLGVKDTVKKHGFKLRNARIREECKSTGYREYRQVFEIDAVKEES